MTFASPLQSGAGSGHLKYLSISLANFNSSLSLRAEVGNYGQASNISINGDVTTAAPGQPAYHRWVGDKSHGGNGYSGGGGCCSDHYDDCQVLTKTTSKSISMKVAKNQVLVILPSSCRILKCAKYSTVVHEFYGKYRRMENFR